jgi:hypothetical protein
MKSRSIRISGIFIIVFILFVFLFPISYLEIKVGESAVGPVVINTANKSNNTFTHNSATKNPIVLINTTNVLNCMSPLLDYQNNSKVYSNEKELENSVSISIDSNNSNEFCKVYSVSDPFSCFVYFVNQSKKPCKIDNPDNDNKVLGVDNFSDKGLLFADTTFENQYTFESIDPVNPNYKIRVSLDFDKHSQGGLNDLNSPRIELVRENMDGKPNMSAAKNQIIIWKGNIKSYFKEPVDDFKNETYIIIQFNTGRHTSDEDDERKGFGVLFDVSTKSNPNLFEFRNDGHYVKYDYETIKQLAGDSFIFYNKDDNGNPVFINNLTDTDNVTLKIVTYLDDTDSRIVETFIDNGPGKEVPYWTINNLSKLKEYDKVDNEDDFMETIKQGSGYVIARTDNIDTRIAAFKSLAFQKP